MSTDNTSTVSPAAAPPSSNRSSMDRLNELIHGPTVGFEQQTAIAAQLQAITDGNVSVGFAPAAFLENDEDAKGHLYGAGLSDPDAEEITLDDRRPEPLRDQLAAELRRISQLYAELADRIDA